MLLDSSWGSTLTMRLSKVTLLWKLKNESGPCHSACSERDVADSCWAGLRFCCSRKASGVAVAALSVGRPLTQRVIIDLFGLRGNPRRPSCHHRRRKGLVVKAQILNAIWLVVAMLR